jgi:hypothetical protein
MVSKLARLPPMDRQFNKLDRQSKRLGGFINSADDERLFECVHVAGAETLPQHCALCGVTISIVPAAPFAEGVSVKLLNGRPETVWQTGDRPTCRRATEAA